MSRKINCDRYPWHNSRDAWKETTQSSKNVGTWVEFSNQKEVLSMFGWWKVWSYAMSRLSHIVRLPTIDSVALPSELNPQFHGAGRRTAAVEGKHLSDLKIVHSYSGLWGSSLHWAIITMCVGNTTLSLWWRPLCWRAMDMAKTWSWDHYVHLHKCLTTPRTHEEQVLSLLKQAKNRNSVLNQAKWSGICCTLVSVHLWMDSGGIIPPPHPSQDSLLRAQKM